MTKDKIEVSMNVYDIPIVIEELEKASNEIKRLQQENKQLKSIFGTAIGLIYDYQMNDKDNPNYKELLYALRGDSDEFGNN